MIVTVCIAIVVAAAIFFFWRTEGAVEASKTPDPVELTSALARQLWRQTWSPGVRPGGPSMLVPVLAFELYPRPMRRVYDWSRELDEGLFRRMRACESFTHIETLQAVTRQVRRDLMLIMTQRGGEVLEDELEEMHKKLKSVERRLTRMPCDGVGSRSVPGPL